MIGVVKLSLATIHAAAREIGEGRPVWAGQVVRYARIETQPPFKEKFPANVHQIFRNLACEESVVPSGLVVGGDRSPLIENIAHILSVF